MAAVAMLRPGGGHDAAGHPNNNNPYAHHHQQQLNELMNEQQQADPGQALAAPVAGIDAIVALAGPSATGAAGRSTVPSAIVTTVVKKKPKTFQAYLPVGSRKYSCAHCRANLANHTELISKSFQGSQGKAYLFNSVVNIVCGPAEERVLLTGLHAVADIMCDCCKTTLGWKYEHAYETSQKYKEGKYIIELVHMIKDNGWDLDTTGRRFKRNSLC